MLHADSMSAASGEPLTLAGSLPPEWASWVLPLFFVVSFLLGSIPWGVIISRLAFHKDIRSEGSGNIGTTNALRTLGKGGGAAVFLLDFGKGALVGFLAIFLIAPAFPAFASLTCALGFAGCTLGHIFSPWLHWHGGKGIAVAAACLLFIYGPVGFAIEIAAFALGVVCTRYVSVGSLAAAVACPILGLWFFWGHWISWLLIAATAGVVIWAHRGNIVRLRAGNENSLGQRVKEGGR